MKNHKRLKTIKIVYSLLAKKNSLQFFLLRKTFICAIIRSISNILMFVLSVIFARALGPDSFGTYTYVMSIMTLLVVLADAGMPSFLMREVACKYRYMDKNLINAAVMYSFKIVMIFSVIISIIGLAVLALKWNTFDTHIKYSVVIMLSTLPFISILKTSSYAIRGLHCIIAGQVFEFLGRPIVVLLIILLFYYFSIPIRVDLAILAQLIAAASVCIISLIWWRSCIINSLQFTQKKPATTIKHSWKSSISFIFLGLAEIINYQADVLMLGLYKSETDVGIYRSASQLAVIVAFALQAANSVIAPHLARLYSESDWSRLERVVKIVARSSFLFAVSVVIVLLFYGEKILISVFGNSYVAAYSPLVILSIGQLANAYFGAVGLLLNMTGYESVVARMLWVTGTVNVIINAILIPKYGATGAAVATAITLISWNYFLYLEVKKKLGISSTAI